MLIEDVQERRTDKGYSIAGYFLWTVELYKTIVCQGKIKIYIEFSVCEEYLNPRLRRKSCLLKDISYTR